MREQAKRFIPFHILLLPLEKPALPVFPGKRKEKRLSWTEGLC